MEIENKGFESVDESDNVTTFYVKKENKKKVQEEMKRMVAISGREVEKYMHKLYKKQIASKRKKKHEEIRKKICFLLYRILHLGRMHPDEFSQKYYTKERLLEMYNDYEKDKSNSPMNVGRYVYLEDDKQGNGNTYWRVGEKIYK